MQYVAVGLSFSQKGKLTKHVIDVHEGKEQKFDCTYCHYSFAKNSGLQRHLKAMHEKPQETESSFQFATCNDFTENLESSEVHEGRDEGCEAGEDEDDGHEREKEVHKNESKRSQDGLQAGGLPI